MFFIPDLNHLVETYKDKQMGQIQEKRINLLQKVCNGTKLKQIISSNMTNNLFVNEKLHIMFCRIPKVACTNWLRAMAIISGKVSPDVLDTIHIHTEGFLKKIGIRALNTYNMTEMIYILNNYFKVLFVRHPYGRFLSAWHSKFGYRNRRSNPLIIKQYAKYIIHKYRTTHRNNKTVEFDEFIQYVAEHSYDQTKTNNHWRQYEHMCYPCHIHYDFIGHLETLNEDFPYMLDVINSSKSVKTFPHSRSGKRFLTMGNIAHYYRSIPNSVMFKLGQVYKRDFLMFGYDPHM